MTSYYSLLTTCKTSINTTVGGLLYTISTSETGLFSSIPPATLNKKYHHHNLGS